MKKRIAALVRLAHRFYYGDVPAHESSAYEHADIAKVKQKAQQGDLDAQHTLACRHYHGKGVYQSSAEAVKWFLVAAEQGYRASQNCICFMYHHGIGVPKNDKEVLKWLRIRASWGNIAAQHDLGEAYFGKKYGISQKNYYDAYIWFSLASSYGYQDFHRFYARKGRKKAEKKLTPADLIRAQDEALKRWEEIQKHNLKQ